MTTIASLRPVVALPVLLVVSLALSSGCASLGSGEEATVTGTADVVDDYPRSRLVALDFVDAMIRLPELDPARTTLYTSTPPSRFGEILVASLQEAGYDLRLGVTDAGATLGYEVRAEPSGAGEGGLYTFVVEAAGVALRRSYRADADGIRPASSMQRRGGRPGPAAAPAPMTAAAPVEAARIRAPSDDMPERTSGTMASGAPGEAPGGAALEPANGSPVTLSAAPAPAPLAPTRLGGADTAPALPRKRNVYESGRSNYADFLARYDTVRQDVMVFPNDSLHMGRDNKRLARAIAEGFDPGRDVISVIGCSHGKTALPNGNEVLAIGRSYRVKEELMLAGIDADLVLEEGCWAGTPFDKMPSRGVLVTHKRRADG